MNTYRMPSTAFANDRTRKGGRMHDQKHLSWIRTLPSVISGEYDCEACHIRMGDPRHRKPSTGKGQKPDDAWTVPMTRAEHAHQHSMNERAFWTMYGVNDPCEIALHLYQITGETDEAEAFIFESVRGRHVRETTS